MELTGAYTRPSNELTR